MTPDWAARPTAVPYADGDPIPISEIPCPKDPVTMRMDDGDIGLIVGCKNPNKNKESSVNKPKGRGAAVPDDLVAGQEVANLAYYKTGALAG